MQLDVGIVWNLPRITDFERPITAAAKFFLRANRQCLCGFCQSSEKSFTKVALHGLIGVEQCPAAGTVARTSGSSAALTGASFRIDESPKVIEAVGGDDARSHQLPKRSFDFRFQFAGAADNVREERSSPLTQEFLNLPRT